MPRLDDGEWCVFHTETASKRYGGTFNNEREAKAYADKMNK